MLPQIDAVLGRAGGVATRQRLLTVVTRGQLDHEIRSGRLAAPFPRALCRPWDVDEPGIRRRAALTSVGPPAALSHATALAMWDLTADSDPVHVTLPVKRSSRGHDGLTVHRAVRFPPVVRLGGLIATSAAESVASSWPLLSHAERRAPAIAAVRNRLATSAELGDAIGRQRFLADRAELLDLVSLLSAGCESELEIWGYLDVFDVPGLRHGVRQKIVHIRERAYRIDLAYEDERVAVELDGDKWHSSRDQRERDRRRDTALAAVGWLTLRFSWQRLHADVTGCRRETLAVLARRR